MEAGKNPLGLYVHIPFCVQKCHYCDFLSFPCDIKMQEAYVDALCREIDGLFEKYTLHYFVPTIYFGGGTPSLLSPELIKIILRKLKSVFSVTADAEITLEANPGTLSREKLTAYRAMGINRLSIGLQSADAEELKILGRIHTWELFQENYEAARRAGFGNINVDVMTALPGQTKEKLSCTLEKVLALNPEHISAYSLILEEGTPFYETYGADSACLGLPDEEEERKLYYLTRDTLVKNGYFHYEISNFAKPGYESRHNSAYWTRQDYIGLGLGASSLLDNVRCRNQEDLSGYIENPCKTSERFLLEKTAQMEEFMFLGLRLLCGVDQDKFNKTFLVPLTEVYGGTLHKLMREGLLCEKDGRIALTDQGIDYGNYVFSAFLLE